MDLQDIRDEDDNARSPTLQDGVKNYLIDIDGTITDDVPNEEPERMATCLPYDGAQDILNAWYDGGHIITFFTSRSSRDHRSVTEEWLNKHGFKYHNLLMDKPRGGNYHWVDNHIVRATRYNGNWTPLIEKEVTIQVFDDEA
jgi:uncharacterized HAD superfamily protein